LLSAAKASFGCTEALAEDPQRMHGRFRLFVGVEGARALEGHLRKGDTSDRIPIPSLYRKHRAKLPTPEEVSSACGVLEEFGWMRIEAAKTSGRSTSRLRLHPSLRELS
jgi:hypothetical protein